MTAGRTSISFRQLLFQRHLEMACRAHRWPRANSQYAGGSQIQLFQAHVLTLLELTFSLLTPVSCWYSRPLLFTSVLSRLLPLGSIAVDWLKQGVSLPPSYFLFLNKDCTLKKIRNQCSVVSRWPHSPGLLKGYAFLWKPFAVHQYGFFCKAFQTFPSMVNFTPAPKGASLLPVRKCHLVVLSHHRTVNGLSIWPGWLYFLLVVTSSEVMSEGCVCLCRVCVVVIPRMIILLRVVSRKP